MCPLVLDEGARFVLREVPAEGRRLTRGRINRQCLPEGPIGREIRQAVEREGAGLRWSDAEGLGDAPRLEADPDRMLAAVERQNVAQLQRAQLAPIHEDISEWRRDASDRDLRHNRVFGAAPGIGDLICRVNLVHRATEDFRVTRVQVPEKAAERSAAATQRPTERGL